MAAEKNNRQPGENIPRHIAIILDGNGRWAKRRGLPRTAGHAVGAETFRKIATYCKDIGVDYLTVYAFSTENWKRPEGEVKTIMRLLNKYLQEAIDTMERDKIRMKIFGDLNALTEEQRELVRKTDEISQRYEGFQANICLNYGGRDEIVHAARRYAADLAAGKVEGELTEERFGSYLYSAGIPDPDLLIRPGGEQRISNFLLWQCAYAEFYFTDVLWPDFSPQELDKAIAEFQRRDRRYGCYWCHRRDRCHWRNRTHRCDWCNWANRCDRSDRRYGNHCSCCNGSTSCADCYNGTDRDTVQRTADFAAERRLPRVNRLPECQWYSGFSYFGDFCEEYLKCSQFCGII